MAGPADNRKKSFTQKEKKSGLGWHVNKVIDTGKRQKENLISVECQKDKKPIILHRKNLEVVFTSLRGCHPQPFVDSEGNEVVFGPDYPSISNVLMEVLNDALYTLDIINEFHGSCQSTRFDHIVIKPLYGSHNYRWTGLKNNSVSFGCT